MMMMSQTAETRNTPLHVTYGQPRVLRESPDALCRDSVAVETSLTMDRVNRSLRRLSLLEDKSSGLSQMSSVLCEEPVSAVPMERMRAEMTKLLDLCVKSQATNETTSCHDKSKRTQRLAAKLEQQLFQMSPTMKDYSNLSSLPLRLRLAMGRLKTQQSNRSSRRRRLAKAQEKTSYLSTRTQASSKKQSRRSVLLEALHGDTARMEEIDDLVQSIRYECSELIGSSCPKCQRKELFDGNFGSQLPEPIRELYFRTPLVQVWEQYSVERLVNLSSRAQLDWSVMILEAQDHLKNYLEWKAQNYTCRR